MFYRKHLRLKEFDYSSENFYFVTVCTKKREKMFVPTIDPRFAINTIKNVAAASYAANNTDVFIKCLQDLQHKYYNNLDIDFYCVMPDHVHIILAFHDKVTKKGAIGSRSYTLGDVIRAFKATVSRDISKSIWQPNFYEHIIRSEKSLEKIRHYILNNPMVEYNNIPWKTIDTI